MSENYSIKSNNKGLSLVEIIIVLAIMSIIGVAAYMTTAMATDKQVNECALKLVSSIEQTRNLTLGKQSGYVHISQASGDYVYVQMYIDGKAYGDLVAVGRPGITVYVGGTKLTDMATGVDIAFERSNGSLKGASPTEIQVTNGRRTMKITIDSYTGRVESKLEV